MSAMLPAWLWMFVAAAGVGYLFLAVVQHDVSLRASRLGWFSLLALASRAICLFAAPLQPWEWPVVAACAGALAAAVAFRRVWLVRVTSSDFRGRLEAACRGLNLECRQHEAGRLELVERQQSHELKIAEVCRGVTWIRLPAVAGPSKTALLVGWLAKQYPGPLPRIHIRMSGQS